MRFADNLVRAIAAACLALAAAGCATRGGGGAARAGSADQTRTLFERNCAACHGQRGEGKQLGTMIVPTLREGRPASYTDEQLFRQIHDGSKGMPPFKYTLDDRQIQELVRFVREEIQGR